MPISVYSPSPSEVSILINVLSPWLVFCGVFAGSTVQTGQTLFPRCRARNQPKVEIPEFQNSEAARKLRGCDVLQDPPLQLCLSLAGSCRRRQGHPALLCGSLGSSGSCMEGLALSAVAGSGTRALSGHSAEGRGSCSERLLEAPWPTGPRCRIAIRPGEPRVC